MSPDMKRLVEAAWCQVPAMDGVVIANTEPYPLCEAIVRAVLMELREMDQPAMHQLARQADNGPPGDRLTWIDVEKVLRALPDFILAEPATA